MRKGSTGLADPTKTTVLGESVAATCCTQCLVRLGTYMLDISRQARLCVVRENAQTEIGRQTRLRLLADRFRHVKGVRYVVPLSKAVIGYRGRRREHLLEAEFLALGTHRTFCVADATDGASYVVASEDQSVGRFMYSWGSYERGQLERAVRVANVPSDLVILDVGANLGTACISGLLAGWFSSAVAIDADELNVRLIKANAALNDLDEKLRVVHAAAGPSDAVATFAIDNIRRGNSKVVSSSELSGNVVEVPMRTLTSLMNEHGLVASDIGLVWVDVEGFESRVIAGAKDLFEQVPWVLEMRGVNDDVVEVARALSGRDVVVLTEHEVSTNRKLEQREIEAIMRRTVDDVCLDVLVLPITFAKREPSIIHTQLAEHD